MIFETEIYRECNEHLKETDKKRDQLAGVYVVLFGLLLANYDKFSSNHRTLTLGIFSLLGIFVILVIIQYRKWHINYIRAAQAVTIFSKLPDKSKERIKISNSRVQTEGYMVKWYNWINPFYSTEAGIFFVLVGIAFIPLQLFLDETKIGIKIAFSQHFAVMINILLFYGILIGVCILVLRKEKSKAPFDNWLLKPLVWASKHETKENESSKTKT
jgi:TM2 domain-containing membrane protein YozV